MKDSYKKKIQNAWLYSADKSLPHLKYIVEKLYKNAKYKQIVDLFSFVIKVEKRVNIPVTDRILIRDYQILSLNAMYWNKNNPEKYDLITSSIRIYGKDMRKFKIEKIRQLLVNNIYKQVIKKEIMML